MFLAEFKAEITVIVLSYHYDLSELCHQKYRKAFVFFSSEYIKFRVAFGWIDVDF